MRTLPYLLIVLIAMPLALGGCRKRTPDERLAKAMELLQQRDSLGAQLEVKELLKKHPEAPETVDARLLLARIYAGEQRPDDALAELDIVLAKVSQKEPRGKAALGMYMNLLRNEKRFDEAMKVIDKYQAEYAKDDFTSLSLTVARVETLTQSGETTAARQILTALSRATTAPADQKLYRGMYVQTLMADKNVSGTVEYLASELDATTAPAERRELMLTLASGSVQLQDYASARKWLGQATELFSKAIEDELDARNRARLALELADAYSQFGNLPGARTIYERLLKNRGEAELVGVSAMGLGQVLLREGRATDTVRLLREVAPLVPQAQFAAQAAAIEEVIRQGIIESRIPPDTAPLTMRFAADTLLAPTQLDLLEFATTAPTAMAAPAGTGATSDTAAAAPPDTRTTGTAN